MGYSNWHFSIASKSRKLYVQFCPPSQLKVKSMSHVAKSRIFEEIIVALRKKGQIIPENIMNDLKSARTMMEITGTSKTGLRENDPKIDMYLEMTEAYLINEASKHFPQEKINEWLQKLEVSACESCVTIIKPNPESRFIAGVPRDQKWVRVQPIENMPAEKLEQMATETKLSFRQEKDGHLVVYGKAEDIKAFIKKMTEQANNK